MTGARLATRTTRTPTALLAAAALGLVAVLGSGGLSPAQSAPGGQNLPASVERSGLDAAALAAAVVDAAALAAAEATVAPPPVPGDAWLSPGEALGPGERLVSANGRFELQVPPQDGSDLYVYEREGPERWTSRRSDAAPPPFFHELFPVFDQLVMQTDGNLVVYVSVAFRGVPISGLTPWVRFGQPGAGLVMQNDGNLVLYAPDGRALWSSDYDRWSSTGPIHFGRTTRLTSSDGSHVLVSQPDGNAVVYGPAGPVWSTGTYGRPGARLAFMPHGELMVVENGGLTDVWQTYTRYHFGAHLRLLDDGTLLIATPWRERVWDSATDTGIPSIPTDVDAPM